ncbi:MAG: tryptophan synthase subunit alpha [Endomicrobia bacterium]|nr:tryptophan synthase subunit alpha [Endomicrobiia bacterium]
MQEFFTEKKQFIPFITCGFPSKKGTVEVIEIFLEESIEIIEIGIPFSDPIADGPTIQYSSFIGLKNNISIDDVFETIEKTLEYKKYIPVIMTYLNPVIIYGVEKFVKNATKAGVKGVIFADCIPEEKDIFYQLTSNYGIYNIFLLSPTTNKQRRKLIYQYSTGFIYLLTLTGTTGVRDKLPLYFYEFIKKVRKETKKPLCAGFGISDPKQVSPVIDFLDGIIVGSAIIKILLQPSSAKYNELKKFIKSFLQII